jgi:hypothetical protein
MARAAVIGPEIYKRVGEVVAEGKNKTEAFKGSGRARVVRGHGVSQLLS